MQLNYGAPRVLDDDVDFAVYTNEQFGLVADIAADGHFAYATPFPSGINLESQTIRLQRLDKGIASYETNSRQALATMLSMLDEEFGDFVDTSLLDLNDEEWRAQFDGPIEYGNFANENHQAGAEAFRQTYNSDYNHFLHAYPVKKRVDILTPLYQQEINISQTASAAPTTDPAGVLFTEYESVFQRLYYDVRDLTSAERNMRGNQLQWMRLNS